MGEITNGLITVNFDTQTVSARELHKVLGVEKRFSAWFETNSRGFVEGEDYSKPYLKVRVQNEGNREVQREVEDYDLSVDMAKHICLMSRTEKGKQCRQYLIDLEKAWNTPEQVFARALKMADKTINDLKARLSEQKPLVDFAIHVSQTKDTIGMDEMAKIARDENIDIGRNRLIAWLKEKKVLMDNRVPYQTFIDRGYFDVIEVKKETTYGTKVFPKTVITGKGQIWIVEKLRKEFGASQKKEVQEA